MASSLCLTPRDAAVRRFRFALSLGLALAGCLALGGCTTVERAGLNLIFDPAEPLEPATRELQDVLYVEGSTHPKHRLDLFLPRADVEDWPTVVFVHGGGWRNGDRDLAFGGIEIYGSLGRRLADAGIGAAVISYRLQPSVSWKQQIHDVARAVAFVRGDVAARGGDPERLFLSGHSAGAQLVTFATLAPWPLDAVGLDRSAVCGVVAVSGAGYDMEDQRTYELGAKPGYYEARFRQGPDDDDWAHEGSSTPWLDDASYDTTPPPDFLVMWGTEEWPALQHQGALLVERLRAAGGTATAFEHDAEHRRMVIDLGDPGDPPHEAMQRFVLETDCAG